MTQLAAPNTVVAPFNDVRLQGYGRTFHLSEQDGEYWIDIDAHDSEPGIVRELARANDQVTRRQMVMTTGSHHQQIYWYSTGDGRGVEYLPFVYLIEEGRWFPRNSVFLKPPRDHLTEQPGLWHMSCNRCHTTHGRPRPDEHDVMDTHLAEFGIACEACHGPGEAHIASHRSPSVRYLTYLGSRSDAKIVNPAQLSHERASHVCAQCHSVNQFYSEEDERHWARRGYRFRPGDKLTDTRFVVRYEPKPKLRRLQGILRYYPHYMEDFFWSDGMIRVSGREFNGLQETACYQRGEMSCLSCHSMHRKPTDERTPMEWANDQLNVGMRENDACLQCHQSMRENISEHTHHLSDSSGSLCYNCHMPHTSYGLLKAMRSHQVDSPNVSVSVKTGRPNACNLCHLDKTLAWTAQHLSAWTDQPEAWLTDDEKSIAGSLLWMLRGDAGQRALLAWGVGWKPAQHTSGTDWIAPFLGQLLRDRYDAVRYIAGRSLRRLPGFEDFSYDHLADSEKLAGAPDRVLEIWGGRELREGERKPEILIHPDGRIDNVRLQQLLQDQDNRRINLNE